MPRQPSAEDQRGVAHPLAVWSTGGLAPGAAAVLDGLPAVSHVSVVAGDLVELVRSERADGTLAEEWDGGWAVPLDAVAFDPAAHAPTVPTTFTKVVAGLQDDEVLLGETSAQLRGLGPGGTIGLRSGHRLTVAAVVPDEVIAGAEVALTRTGGERTGIDTDRFALVVHDGDRAELEAAIHATLPERVRVRGPGESPFLRHGDAVLTQAQVKERFGEFAARTGPDGTLELDPAWVRQAIVTVEVPVLGQLTCHRSTIERLTRAMTALGRQGLDHLVDPDSFGGCWNPRLVGADRGISRHSWGIAVDLEVGKHPTGLASVLDPRLVATMEREGFTWGGLWLVPDPAHFELVD